MNIKEAKEQIKNAVRLYLKKEDGDYVIPVENQRPIFLEGVPGIGKTAIVAQIAEELGIAMVSYSMTHHTRQSALGLPVIKQKEYEGMEYQVSEYTMSEIIASIYEVMKSGNQKEGILFLDEINCVSETLAPAMLLFLQYKVFGSYKVPEGWVVVTAGNPPEYNRSVREFDVVTLDRMRVIHVDADYESWKEYAVNRGVHPSVLSYLERKKEHFYLVESKVMEKNYVTARGWEDLSEMIWLSEKENLPVSPELINQYLNKEEVATEFFSYYELFCKYEREYALDDILRGKVSEAVKEKAANASFDERISLVRLILGRIWSNLEEIGCMTRVYQKVSEALKGRENLKKTAADSLAECEKRRQELIKSGTFSEEKKKDTRKEKAVLERLLMCNDDGEIKDTFNQEVKALKTRKEEAKEALEQAFSFLETVYGEREEMLLFVTQLSLHRESARFILQFGSEKYREKSEKLRLSKREDELRAALSELKEKDTYRLEQKDKGQEDEI